MKPIGYTRRSAHRPQRQPRRHADHAAQRENHLLKSSRDFDVGTRSGGGVAAMADAMYLFGDDELRAPAHFMSHLP